MRATRRLVSWATSERLVARTRMETMTGNILFVEQVQNYPCLYNNNLAEYSRKDITDKAWAEIAEQQNSTVSSCKEKWKNLRTVFVRQKKRRGDGLVKSEDGRKNAKPYYLNKYMKFILPYIKASAGLVPSPPHTPEIKEEVNVKIKEDQFTVPEETSAPPDVNKVMRKPSHVLEANKTGVKYLHRKNIASTSENPRRQFLLSLLPEIEDLTEPEFRFFKRRSLSLIDEISITYPEYHLNQNILLSEQSPVSDHSSASTSNSQYNAINEYDPNNSGNQV